MLPLDDLNNRIEKHIAGKRPYKIQAYLFILGALEFTMESLGRRKSVKELNRHVSGQELSFGIRDFAKMQFGPTAGMVFDHWGLKATSDFGRIVYDLIDMGLLGKNNQDSIDDFNSVFEFDQEMVHQYRFKSEK